MLKMLSVLPALTEKNRQHIQTPKNPTETNFFIESYLIGREVEKYFRIALPPSHPQKKPQTNKQKNPSQIRRNFFIESYLVGRDLKEFLCRDTHGSVQQQLSWVAHSHIQPGLEHFQGWGFSGQLVPGLPVLAVKNCFLTSILGALVVLLYISYDASQLRHGDCAPSVYFQVSTSVFLSTIKLSVF